MSVTVYFGSEDSMLCTLLRNNGVTFIPHFVGCKESCYSNYAGSVACVVYLRFPQLYQSLSVVMCTSCTDAVQGSWRRPGKKNAACFNFQVAVRHGIICYEMGRQCWRGRKCSDSGMWIAAFQVILRRNVLNQCLVSCQLVITGNLISFFRLHFQSSDSYINLPSLTFPSLIFNFNSDLSSLMSSSHPFSSSVHCFIYVSWHGKPHFHNVILHKVQFMF